MTGASGWQYGCRGSCGAGRPRAPARQVGEILQTMSPTWLTSVSPAEVNYTGAQPSLMAVERDTRRDAEPVPK